MPKKNKKEHPDAWMTKIMACLQPTQKRQRTETESQDGEQDGGQAGNEPQRVPKRIKVGVESGPYGKFRATLPIWDYQNEIRAAVDGNDGRGQVLIISGQPGSGKSTQVPQFLRKEKWCKGMIAVTEPRRVAAVTLAHRVSREVGTPIPGPPKEGEVGYSVRFDQYMPYGPKIKFLTEGMLLQEHMRDRGLSQYSCIIVDEIHERGIDAEILLAFLKLMLMGKVPERKGKPLKVVVMSATANIGTLREYFEEGPGGPSVKVLEIPGRQHPVEIVHLSESVDDLRDALAMTVLDIHHEEPFPGDILAFLDGQDEIEAAQSMIEAAAANLGGDIPKIDILPLYGQQSTDDQKAAFEPSKTPRTRKVILATNIAETSVTVPGVKYVVDCGHAKIKQFRSTLGMESLNRRFISKSSAMQRAGRAGREAAGKCFRLYTEEEYNKMGDFNVPEIQRVNQIGVVLALKARGVEDVLTFPLMENPDEQALIHAHRELVKFGALVDTEPFSITETGRKMAGFPVSARLARVLVAAATAPYDCLVEVIDIVACMTTGREIFPPIRNQKLFDEVAEVRDALYRREGDLLTYLVTMRRYTAENVDRVEWCRQRCISSRVMKEALQIRRQLREMCVQNGMLAMAPPKDPQPFEEVPPEEAETIIKCFLEGLWSHTAVLKGDVYHTNHANQEKIFIHPSSVLCGRRTSKAIMFVEATFTSKHYARKVTRVKLSWIQELENKYKDSVASFEASFKERS